MAVLDLGKVAFVGDNSTELNECNKNFFKALSNV